MTRSRVLGMVLTVVGLAAYVLGVYVKYPGRSLSLTAVMVGIPIIFFKYDREENEVTVNNGDTESV